MRPPRLPDPLLTSLWTTAPSWLHRLLHALLGVSEDACHEWLCPSLGCRCTSPADVELVA